MKSSQLIDACIAYINLRNANYIAKDNLVVFFCSPTGRKTDRAWNKQSPTETVRIIQSTQLGFEDKLELSHLLAAFQELDRVFEYSVSSTSKVLPEVFNYLSHSDTSVIQLAASLVAKELYGKAFTTLFYNDLEMIMGNVSRGLQEKTTSNEVRKSLILAHTSLGYDYRHGNTRFSVVGVKYTGFTWPVRDGYITYLDDRVIQEVSDKVVKELR